MDPKLSDLNNSIQTTFNRLTSNRGSKTMKSHDANIRSSSKGTIASKASFNASSKDPMIDKIKESNVFKKKAAQLEALQQMKIRVLGLSC